MQAPLAAPPKERPMPAPAAAHRDDPATARSPRQRTPRMLGHGDLRLLLLALLEPQPRHGYELIQLVGEIFHGQYQPSPGALYPSLSGLQDEGLVAVRRQGARRLHALTAAGRDYIDTHAHLLAQARLRTEASARALAKAGLPAPVRSGMGALKRALASHQGQWDRHRSQAVADLLLRAAADIAAVTDD
ncbi:MAG: PadR family transcriptional regulator [Ottowia sp.]|jgi:DNA-binding PadR family transcriptional regulator|nr:MAG: PadR family transcriptional regulator [Ottowia sp.]